MCLAKQAEAHLSAGSIIRNLSNALISADLLDPCTVLQAIDQKSDAVHMDEYRRRWFPFAPCAHIAAGA